MYSERTARLHLGLVVLLISHGVAQEMCLPPVGPHIHQPQFHIIGSLQSPDNNKTFWPGGVNDVNGVFQHNGLFHVMHQCDGGGPQGLPCGGGHSGQGHHRGQTWWHTWGHLVSEDLVHWRRVADALTPPPYGTPGDYEFGEDCDGTVSFTKEGPVIMFGPACDHPKGLLRDAAIVGVARAANASDPQLLVWNKDTDPVQFDGTPCAFPGSVWESANKTWNMICAVNNVWGRYTTPGDSLHGPWKLVDPKFAATPEGSAVGGSSGPSFLPLPNPRPGEPTHVISDGSNAVFQYGVYDAEREKLVLSPQTFPIDHGNFEWAAAGLAESDGRILSLGWGKTDDGHARMERGAGCPRVGGIEVCGVQTLSAIRVLTYEAQTKMILANVADEYKLLHNASLFASQSVGLPAGQAYNVPLPQGKGLAIDAEFALVLPANESVTLETTVMTDASGGGGVTLKLSIPAPTGSPSRTATASVSGSNVIAPTNSFTFPVLEGEKTVTIRVLVDRSIVEFFLAGGRAATTARFYPTQDQSGMRLQSQNAATITNVTVFEMGCSWAPSSLSQQVFV